MKVTELFDICKKIDENIVPGEFMINLKDSVTDISNYTEAFYYESQPIEIDRITYLAGEAGIADEEHGFLKFKSIRPAAGEQILIRNSNQAVAGDLVWVPTMNSFDIGYLDDDKLLPANGKKFVVEYYGYPIITEDGVVPSSIAHILKTRMRAESYAIMRQWDRAGYYNRIAERSQLRFKQAVWSTGPQKIINVNTSF